MNEYRDSNCGGGCCYFHPKEVVVGVCPLCLNERLLILASKQRHHHHHHHHNSSANTTTTTTHNHMSSNKSSPYSITLPKIFAFGSLLNRLEFRHSKSDYADDLDTPTTQEDSFISIKFEDNGAASWEKKNNVSKVSLDHNNYIKEEKMSVVEHAKVGRGSLRWRKRIGQLFQLIRWKRSNKANVCHVGTKVEGVKVRKQGWIRTLTKRRTKQ